MKRKTREALQTRWLVALWVIFLGGCPKESCRLDTPLADIESRLQKLEKEKKKAANRSDLLKLEQAQEGQQKRLAEQQKSLVVQQKSLAEQQKSLVVQQKSLVALEKRNLALETKTKEFETAQTRQKQRSSAFEEELRVLRTQKADLEAQQKAQEERLKDLAQKLRALEVWRRSAAVWFRSQPEGAEVQLDGERKGETPLRLVLEQGKRYRVSWEKEGYFREEREEKYEGLEGESRVHLEASTQQIHLKSKPGGAILRFQEEGKGKRRTAELPVLLTLKKRTLYQGVVELKGYKPLRVAVDLTKKGKEAAVVEWELEPEDILAGSKMRVAALGGNAVYVPKGSFMMGASPEDREREDQETPQAKVHISRGFWMLETEVTQKQYNTLSQTNPSWFKTCENCPVEQVSWHDAARFANELSQREKRPACFVCNKTGCKRVKEYIACRGWRLPTEAEWEYAAKYKVRGNPEENAWYDVDATKPVGSKKANPLGLKDMLGNVWEWTGDGLRRYTEEETRDPLHPDNDSKYAIRGGSWGNIAKQVRFTARMEKEGTAVMRSLGFRLVRFRW